MEQYLQELDKINELLVFTDKRPFQLETDVDILDDDEYDLETRISVTRDVTPIHSIPQLDTIIQDISKVGETIVNTCSPYSRLV